MKLKCFKVAFAAVLSMTCLFSFFALQALALMEVELEDYTWYTNLEKNYTHTWDFASEKYGNMEGEVTGHFLAQHNSLSGPISAGGSTQLVLAVGDLGKTEVYVMVKGYEDPEYVGFHSSSEYYSGKAPLTGGYINAKDCDYSVNSGWGYANAYGSTAKVLHVAKRKFDYGSSNGEIDYTVTVLPN